MQTAARRGTPSTTIRRESCRKLIRAGYEVAIEAGAGAAAGFGDATYRDLGVAPEADAAALIRSGDLVLKVNAPATGRPRDEVSWMRPGAVYLGSLMPLRHLDAVRALAALRSEDLTSMMRPLLEDPEPRLAITAAATLANFIPAWRAARVSKYNHAREYSGALPSRYVLVADQTLGDASIRYGLADASSFARMFGGCGT